MSPEAHQGAEWIVAGRRYRVRFDRPVDCGRLMRFDGTDPALFGTGPATLEPLRVGGFCGSVALGSPVNVDRIHVVPHCQGTHTESAGHLTAAPLPLPDIFRPGPVPATLVTATPARGIDAVDELGPAGKPDDRIVTARSVSEALEGASAGFLVGLVLRVAKAPSRPDSPLVEPGVDRAKSDLDGSEPGIDRSEPGVDAAEPGTPTYLSAAAAALLRDKGVRHLVLELPSVDRPEDGGLLAAHRAWWAFGDERPGEPSLDRREATLTELARIPSNARDGSYLLDLHLPAFRTDAVPSRPVLYPVESILLQP